MEAIKLIRIDHDNLENRNARFEQHIGTFTGSEKLTAHGVCSEWISANLKGENMYLGWDGNVYPQFKIEKIQIINE